MTWSPASALCGSTVMEEARQHGVLGSRLDLMEHPAFHDEGAVQDRAIQAALAGVAFPWRHQLISRQLC